MSRTLRGRTIGYDNVSAGNATGIERTTGTTMATEKIGGGSNPSSGNAFPAGSANIPDDISVGVVTLKGERLG